MYALSALIFVTVFILLILTNVAQDDGLRERITKRRNKRRGIA